MTYTHLTAITVALALAACTGEPDNRATTDLEKANSDGEMAAMAQALPAGDFVDLTLGPKIVGPQGPEVETSMRNAAGSFADMRSYVVCPESMNECKPTEAPEETIYTYVHVVYPGADNEGDTGSSTGNTSSDIERATRFRMIRPASGFTGEAGYSKAEALAAIGPKADVVITCDDGALVWTVSAGDGGDQWEQKEPLTFYWRSTLPPAGPAEIYEIEANYATAQGSGPYPGENADAPNACTTGR